MKSSWASNSGPWRIADATGGCAKSSMAAAVRYSGIVPQAIGQPGPSAENCVAPVDQLVGGCGDPPAIQDRAALAPVTRRSRANIRETNGSACTSITSSPLANRTATVLARRCRGRRCRLEGQQAGDADNPQYLPFHGMDVAPALVVKQARRDQPDDASSRVQLATACGQDVLDPVGRTGPSSVANTLAGVWHGRPQRRPRWATTRSRAYRGEVLGDPVRVYGR